jgi:acyl-CoA synthetase (AMP-forming)/AMP-acid ligase II
VLIARGRTSSGRRRSRGTAQLRLTIVPDGVELADSTVITEVISETSMQPVDVEQDALALLLFTSGTSGAPRRAMLSHRNLLVNQQQMLAADPTSMLRGDLVLGVLLLHHVYGLNVVLGVALRVGAHVGIGGAVVEENELIEFCVSHLPRNKIPSVIEVHDELPVGLTGKVARRLLS